MPTIKISGMNCNHCVASVTDALNGIAGIKDVNVNLEEKEATYKEESPIDMAVIKNTISAIGFTVE